MNTSVSPLASQPVTRNSAPAHPPAAASPAPAASAPDRIASGLATSAPLLTVGATALAQLIPGTVEAEGALGIATALRIGVGAAITKNPVVGAALAAGALAAGNYVKTLAGDVMHAQPVVRPITDAAADLDSSVRAGLGIPSSADR